mmetsp:Transcript_10333/g.19855  ORF Transcript_10333/g.19855 Transcript_10333/m.19855 type:complete len:305 (+) Transcript_10333:241-1155(+)
MPRCNLQPGFDVIRVHLPSTGLDLLRDLPNGQELPPEDFDRFSTFEPLLLVNDGGIIKNLFANRLDRGLDVTLIDSPGELQKGREGVIEGLSHPRRLGCGKVFPFLHILLHVLCLNHGTSPCACSLDTGAEELHISAKGARVLPRSGPMTADTEGCGSKAKVLLRAHLQSVSHSNQVDLSIRAKSNFEGLLLTPSDKCVGVLLPVNVWLNTRPDIHSALHLTFFLLQFVCLLHHLHLLHHNAMSLLLRKALVDAPHCTSVLHHRISRVGDPQFANIRLHKGASEHDIEKDEGVKVLNRLSITRL